MVEMCFVHMQAIPGRPIIQHFQRAPFADVRLNRLDLAAETCSRIECHRVMIRLTSPDAWAAIRSINPRAREISCYPLSRPAPRSRIPGTGPMRNQWAVHEDSLIIPRSETNFLIDVCGVQCSNRGLSNMISSHFMARQFTTCSGAIAGNAFNLGDIAKLVEEWETANAKVT